MKQTDIKLNTVYRIESAAVEYLPRHILNVILEQVPNSTLTYSWFFGEVTLKGVEGRLTRQRNSVNVRLDEATLARVKEADKNGAGDYFKKLQSPGITVLSRHVIETKQSHDDATQAAAAKKAADIEVREARMRAVAAQANPIDLAAEVLDLRPSEIHRSARGVMSALSDLIENATEMRERIEGAFEKIDDGNYPVPRKTHDEGDARRYLPMDYDGLHRRVNGSYERLLREVSGYERVAAVFNVLTRAGLDPVEAQGIIYPKD